MDVLLGEFKKSKKSNNFSKDGSSINKVPRKKKQVMQEELLILEQLEEENLLSSSQMSRKVTLIQELLKIYEEDELYWFKRSHEKWLLEGDGNTEFLHRVDNGRRRRNTIISLENGDEAIEGDENLLAHATAYYKELFGLAEGNTFPLDPDLWRESEKVLNEDNDWLVRPFSEEEIKTALFQMEKSKVAGPDKIPIEFYQVCWDVVKDDIVELFEEFHKGEIEVCSLNYGVITLLPKIQEAAKIQQFSPICLLNCLYKWITKTLALRLERVVDKLILQTQSAFMNGRNTMNGVMALREVCMRLKETRKLGWF